MEGCPTFCRRNRGERGWRRASVGEEFGVNEGIAFPPGVEIEENRGGGLFPPPDIEFG